MVISINTRQAYSEVDEFLELLDADFRNQVPKKLREYFKEEKDINYKKNIEIKVPIKEQNLKEETLAIIALLNLQYWCKDEVEKENLKKVYSENERKYQDELREKYNADNIFRKHTQENKIEESTVKEEVALIEYKESIFKRFINKIKSFFNMK